MRSCWPRAPSRLAHRANWFSLRRWGPNSVRSPHLQSWTLLQEPWNLPPRPLKTIRMSGKMDAIGTQQIDLKFTALTATAKTAVLVDLSKVALLASIGIRTLVSKAQA